MSETKSNSEKIKEFIAKQRNSLYLSSKRKNWWPKYLYHYSDVNNIVSILESNHLYSRKLALEKGLLKVDIASSGIISNTRNRIKSFVRLYFRPKTPTQYRNEGIRPISQRELDSHCPVPIYLIFDSEHLLSLPESKFSKGNLAIFGKSFTDDLSKLFDFPFDLIYHDTSVYDEDEKRKVVAHRNAEVIIPNSLNLNYLKHIVCRSSAEKDTLLNLLSDDSYQAWKSKITIDTKNYFFWKKWTYVEEVILSSSYLILQFPPDSKSPGPFKLNIERHNRVTDDITSGEIPQIMCEGRKRINFKKDSEEYSIKIHLDDDLIYSDSYEYYDLPF